MSLTLPLTPAEEAKLLEQARAQGTTPEDLVRQAIEPILNAVAQDPLGARKLSRPIAEVIAERMNSVPPEVFERLPRDGASEHDHYLYGSPKRNG
jgi:hypothetical protein